MIDYNDYVDDLIKKDNEAFKIVYENTKKGVFSMIISIVNNKAATEDLMQDTYMKMIQKIHTYKKGRNFFAWLLQIAKNTAIDYLRNENKVHVLEPNHITFERMKSKDYNTQNYEVMDMIKNLNEVEKQVVLLRIISKIKFKDIAKSLNKPIGTVLWIYQKSINKLRKTI